MNIYPYFSGFYPFNNLKYSRAGFVNIIVNLDHLNISTKCDMLPTCTTLQHCLASDFIKNFISSIIVPHVLNSVVFRSVIAVNVSEKNFLLIAGNVQGFKCWVGLQGGRDEDL